MSQTIDQPTETTNSVPTPDVEIRRNAGLTAFVAVAAAMVTVAYLTRALDGGSLLDWALCVLFGVVAVSQLRAVVDSRTPLLVADAFGIRMRLGSEWRGLPWAEVERVVVEPASGPLRDGRLLVEPCQLDQALEGLDSSARRQVAWAERLYSAPLVTPLGLSTRLNTKHLVPDLAALAAGRCQVAEMLAPAQSAVPVQRSAYDEEPAPQARASTSWPVEVEAEAADVFDQEQAEGQEQDDGAVAGQDAVPEAAYTTDDERRPFFGFTRPWNTPTHDELAHDQPAHDEPAYDDEAEYAESLAEADTEGTMEVSLGSLREAAASPKVFVPHGDFGSVPGLDLGPDEAGQSELLDGFESRDGDGESAVAGVSRFESLRRGLRALVSRDVQGRDRDTDALMATDDVEASLDAKAEADAVADAVGPALPLRNSRPASRIDVTLPAAAEETFHARREAAAQGRAAQDARTTRPATIGHFVDEPPPPVPDPVIGLRIRAARKLLGTSVERLSERTRIRPHVLEAIEVDDFEACGGDFYARGHLRNLARELGLDSGELLALYDEHYAAGPIAASRVFEAELATSMVGGIRGTSNGGPRWSLMVGAVLAMVLVWGLARMFAPPTAQVAAPPSDSARAGLAANHGQISSPLVTPRRLVVTAVSPGSRVVVHERSGRVLFAGHLAAGKHKVLVGVAPFTVRARHANAVTVRLAGSDRGPIGTQDVPAQRTIR